jgi:hypothetical protein
VKNIKDLVEKISNNLKTANMSSEAMVNMRQDLVKLKQAQEQMKILSPTAAASMKAIITPILETQSKAIQDEIKASLKPGMTAGDAANVNERLGILGELNPELAKAALREAGSEVCIAYAKQSIPNLEIAKDDAQIEKNSQFISMLTDIDPKLALDCLYAQPRMILNVDTYVNLINACAIDPALTEDQIKILETVKQVARGALMLEYTNCLKNFANTRNPDVFNNVIESYNNYDYLRFPHYGLFGGAVLALKNNMIDENAVADEINKFLKTFGEGSQDMNKESMMYISSVKILLHRLQNPNSQPNSQEHRDLIQNAEAIWASYHEHRAPLGTFGTEKVSELRGEFDSETLNPYKKAINCFSNDDHPITVEEFRQKYVVELGQEYEDEFELEYEDELEQKALQLEVVINLMLSTSFGLNGIIDLCHQAIKGKLASALS